MPRIDSAATPAKETSASGTEATPAKSVPEETTAHFSDLLSKGREGREGDGETAKTRDAAERPGSPWEATGRTTAGGRGEPLRGPAEGLFRQAAGAPGDGGKEGGGMAHGGRPGRSTEQSAGRDAERLAAGGVLPAAAQAVASQNAEPPLGVSAAGAASEGADVDIIAELADRILVAEPKAGQNEVRIRLNMDTLQGTEITLKNDGTRLSVAFETPSPEIAERLAAAQPALAERLQEKTGLEVKVEIAHAEQQADKQRDGERNDGRSRNRFDYEPDHGDDA